jgi:hypothetical protein
MPFVAAIRAPLQVARGLAAQVHANFSLHRSLHREAKYLRQGTAAVELSFSFHNKGVMIAYRA